MRKMGKIRKLRRRWSVGGEVEGQHDTRGDATFYASALTYITPPGKRHETPRNARRRRTNQRTE